MTTETPLTIPDYADPEEPHAAAARALHEIGCPDAPDCQHCPDAVDFETADIALGAALPHVFTSERVRLHTELKAHAGHHSEGKDCVRQLLMDVFGEDS